MVRDGAHALPDAPAGIEVRRSLPKECDVYIHTVIAGFFGREPLTPEELRLGATLYHMPCTATYLAYLDGKPAGGGGMSIRNNVASLFGDATLPIHRGRGVHTATIRQRISEAIAAGCDLITAGTNPGSASHRNYHRMGFQVAYTKATMVLD